MRHLILIIHGLTGGGAERVLLTLAEAWLKIGHPVTIITLADSKSDFYSIPQGCQRIPLNLMGDSHSVWGAIKNNACRLWRLRQAISKAKPDIVISFCDIMNIQTLLATKGLRVPVIVTEHIDPFQHPLKPIWQYLRRWTYPWATWVTVLTENVASQLQSLLPSARITTMPNPLPLELCQREVRAYDPNSREIVAMGRLSQQKGFDLLIKSFAAVQDRFPEWQLTIWGEGEERPTLENLINTHKARVSLQGMCRDVWAQMEKAGFFVLSSRYEGLGMVLIEAMALGRPCLTVDCKSGPREVTQNGDLALLVPMDQLQKGLERLMTDVQLRQELAHKALKVREIYDLKLVLSNWQKLFESLHK